MGTREELAWAAGLFDGEGYIGCVKRVVQSHGRRVPHLNMSVSQWHRPEVTERFSEALGVGRVVLRTRQTARGAVNEYVWRAGGVWQVQAAFAMLWPWLSAPKQEQIRAAVEMYRGEREVTGVREWRRRG